MWKLDPSERALALETEAGLRKVVGPPDVQEALPQIDRLERLRETLAVLGRTRLRMVASGSVNTAAAGRKA